MTWYWFIEILRIVFSMPFVILLLGLLGGWYFREELKIFIRFMVIRWPGGPEISSQQQPPPDREAIEVDREEGLDRESISVAKQEYEHLISNFKEALLLAGDLKAEKNRLEENFDRALKEHGNELIEEYEKLVKDKASEAKLWKFRFLDNFLASHTKGVLAWLALFTVGVSRVALDIAWGKEISGPEEKDTIINVLLRFGLAVEAAGKLFVTSEGRLYLSHMRGPTLPKPATSGP